jgi:small-conductance mechanosensitive channel
MSSTPVRLFPAHFGISDADEQEPHMFESIQTSFSRLRHVLDWAPDALVAVILMVIAAIIALVLHALVIRSLARFTRARQPFVHTLITATKGPTRLAVLIMALTAALPAAPIAPQLGAALTKIFVLATIILVGWVAITAVNMAADLYLSRFRLDVADNLLARKHITQVNILKRSAITLVTVVTAAAALMTFETVRQYGVSLFASAGVAGLVVGFAARPVLSNMIAGVQMAITQPIRIDDVVIVEGEWGRIEEITSTYVVVCIWDLRRLIVPLTYFIEKPFQNWTRASAELLGTVFVYVDYTVPVDRVRAKVEEIVKASPLWDGKVVGVQVTDAKPDTLEVRALASAKNSGDIWNLRCELREKLIDFLQREYPGALPKQREQVIADVTMAQPG